MGVKRRADKEGDCTFNSDSEDAGGDVYSA